MYLQGSRLRGRRPDPGLEQPDRELSAATARQGQLRAGCSAERGVGAAGTHPAAASSERGADGAPRAALCCGCWRSWGLGSPSPASLVEA